LANLVSNTTVGGESLVDLLNSTFFVGEDINIANFNSYVNRGTVVVRAANGAICFGEVASQGTWTVTSNTTTINEGSQIDVTVTTTNIPDGIYYWTTNKPTDASNGQFTLSNNQGQFSVSVTADLTTEGSEDIIVNIRTGSELGTVVGNSGAVTIVDTSLDPIEGEAIFLSTGTHSFTVPNVSTISIVAIGGGGGGGAGNQFSTQTNIYGCGGGGGALRYNWTNPPAGEVLTVYVGAGGAGGANGGYGSPGQGSYVSSPSLGTLVSAGAGGGGGRAYAGYTSQQPGTAGQLLSSSPAAILQTSFYGGGIGGYGGIVPYTGGSGGGGGAGGYAQRSSGYSGGVGASYIYNNNTVGQGYSGGGSGGTGIAYSTANLTLGGGGTGCWGTGPYGPVLTDVSGQNGNPGSYGLGQLWGGGGAGAGADYQQTAHPGAPGEDGVVRIIWSDRYTRRFPTTYTSNSYGTITVV